MNEVMREMWSEHGAGMSRMWRLVENGEVEIDDVIVEQ